MYQARFQSLAIAQQTPSAAEKSPGVCPGLQDEERSPTVPQLFKDTAVMMTT